MIKYRKRRRLHIENVKDLTRLLIKYEDRKVEVGDIFSFIEDILQYLENNESNDYKTN